MDNKFLSILIIEDSESDMELIIREFQKTGHHISHKRVETADEMQTALENSPWDLIIADYNLPEFNAPTALTVLQKSGLDIPFIMVSGTIGEETAAAIMKAGAHDYVMKRNLTRLIPAVQRELGEAQTRRANKKAEERIKQAAEELRKSEKKYHDIFENAIEGICQSTPEGRYLSLNPAMAHMYGYETPDEMIAAVTDIGKQLYIESDKRNQYDRLLDEYGMVKDFEILSCKKDGTSIWVSVSALAVKDDEGRVLYYDATVVDVTTRKQAEETLKETLEKLRRNLVGTIQAMSMMVEVRDPYTAGHQRRVSNLARTISQEMGLTKDTVENIRMASTIHDIGKISVPAEILSKPTELTILEMALIKVHPQAGYDILKDVDLPFPIAEIVLQHHERLDGSGYPQGLKDSQILLGAKIVAAADIVEAIASHRPYRAARGIDAALDEIDGNKGILYDPDVAEVCLRLLREKGFRFE